MKNVLLILAVTLAGCAAPNTGVVSIAENTYMIGKQDWMAYSGSMVKAELYKEAMAFCAAKGKKSVPLNSSATDYVAYRTSAGAEIQFKCE